MANLTIFTSKHLLTKKFWKDGRKEKVTPFSNGIFEVRDVKDHSSLKALIESLTTNQALSYSTPLELTKGTIVTKGNEDEAKDILARTKEFFHYPNGHGWLFIDHDEDLSENEVVSCLERLYRPFGSTTYVYATSASHGIKDKRGFHLYFMVEDISIVRQAMDNLFKRAFNSGYGRCSVTDSGRVLNRTFFDKAIYLQTGLDFISGPMCMDFKAPKRDIRVIQRDCAILDLSPLLARVDASEAIELERRKVKWESIKATVKAARATGRELNEYKAVRDGGELRPGTKLFLEDGTEKDVADFLMLSMRAYLNDESLNNLSV